MSAASIDAKVKKSLAKAAKLVGGTNDVPIYRVRKTQAGTPLSPASTETSTLLVNATFQEYSKTLTDINIQAGDRRLVSNADVDIGQNDIIRQGTTDYIVVIVDDIAPGTDSLVYKTQCRQQ